MTAADTCAYHSNNRLKGALGPAMSNQQFSTKDRILGAAEELFAQFGFAGTSLRQVTGRADVNIAAVNYHFGSKENLVNEVFRRRMDVMSAQRLSRLREAQAARPGQLEPVLAAFVEPALAMAQDKQPGELEPILAAFVEPALAMAQDRHGGGAFVRVIARAYAEKNDGLRKFLSDHYGYVQRDFGRAIAACLPRLSKEELYWRLDFLGGALTYAMADFGLIKRPEGVSEAAHRERGARELIRFAAAGFQS